MFKQLKISFETELFLLKSHVNFEDPGARDNIDRSKRKKERDFFLWEPRKMGKGGGVVARQ